MSWSDKYKRSINCDNPSGFSQKAHCAARKKRQRGETTKSKSPFNEMHQLKTHKTVEQIAKKHRLEVSFIKKQLEMGIPIEHEHAKDKDLATDIALQHLDEIPDYYTRLIKMERDAKKEHKKKFKDVSEGTLHHWFKGSRSKEGKPGWVQADGSPCANEPGETKTPKCFSSGRLKSLKSKGEKGEALIRSAVRRKRAKDKGQQGKSGAASPTNVPTFAKGKKDPNYVKAEPGIKEAMEINEASKDKPGKGSGKKDACYNKVKARYDVWPSAYASGALVKCRKVGAANWGTKSESTDSLDYDWDTPVRERADRYCPKCEKLERRNECKYGPRYWDAFSLPAELIGSKKDYNVTMPHPGNFPESYDHEYSMARSELSTIISAAKRLQKKMKKGEGNIEAWVQSKITKAADYIDTAADYVDSGEMAKESVSVTDANGNHYAEFIDIVKPEPLKPSKGLGSKILGEGPSFEIGGRKSTGMGGMTPQDVDRLKQGNPGAAGKIDQKYQQIRQGINLPLAKKETKKQMQVAHYELFGDLIYEGEISNITQEEIQFVIDTYDLEGEQLNEFLGALLRLGARAAGKLAKPIGRAITNAVDRTIDNTVAKAATKTVAKSASKIKEPKITYKQSKPSTVQYGGGAAPKPTQPTLSRSQAQKALDDDPWTRGAVSRDDVMRVRQDRRALNNEYEYSNWRSDFGLSEDWQKVNRKDKTDGLSQAAVNAYRRENPGSKLQTAVTEKKPKGKRAKRRANFCRRMKGMKSKLTSAETARDPDSRINKALRRWRCN